MNDLIPLSTFLSVYLARTDMQPEDFDETDILNFAVDSVEKLQNEKWCNHIVKLLNVSNYNAARPRNFYKIVEIAYSGTVMKHQRPMYRDKVISYTGQTFEGCDIKISIECPKCHEHKCSCGDDAVKILVDDDWLLANSQRYYWDNPRYLGSYGLNRPDSVDSLYHPEFQLIRPAQHKFFGANYHVGKCINLDRRLLANCPIEYKMENRHFRINAEEGTILLAYLEMQTGDDGYPMIPNDSEVFEAVFWEVESKMLYKNKRKHPKYYEWAMNAKQLGADHMSIAKTKLDAIPYAEWMAIIRNLVKRIPYKSADAQAGRVMADKFDGAIKRYR